MSLDEVSCWKKRNLEKRDWLIEVEIGIDRDLKVDEWEERLEDLPLD